MKKLLLNKAPFFFALLSGCFIFFWYFSLNKYIVLYYQEHTQMFQFTCAYLKQCLAQPGGVSVYLGTFLVQFFYCPAAGAVIYTILLTALFATYVFVLKQFDIKPSLFAFIPVLFILLFSTDIYFQLTIILTLIFALSGFKLIGISGKPRCFYITIPLCICLLYLFSGGGILMTISLCVLYSFLQKKRNYTKYSITALLSGIITPVIFWYFIYLVPFKEACFSFTPFSYLKTNYIQYYSIAWILFLTFPLFRNLRTGGVPKLIASAVLVISTAVFVMAKYNRSGDYLIRMMQKAETNQWEDIMDNESNVKLSPNKCFYLNLALYETGQMPDKMFHYDQVGPEGLFLSAADNFSACLRSDFYLQLGLINEAKRQAYESLVGYSYYGRLNILTVKRLLLCALMESDEKITDKYGSMLSHTLFYRNSGEMFDSGYEKIRIVEPSDFFVENPGQVLIAILEKDPYHQMAFEYLMAYCMLRNEFEQAKQVFDMYFYNFNYPAIPDHYAELLILYKQLNNIGDEFFQTYPIKRDIRENFEIMDILIMSMKEGDKEIITALEEQFKHTYWFYVKFPLVNISTEQNHETKTIY